MKNNNNLKIIMTILMILLVVVLAWMYVKSNEQENNNVINNTISLDKTFNNEDVNENDIDDKMTYENNEGLSLEKPQENEVVNSPVNIEGEAVGSWYFEANFRVKLVDRESGDIIVQSYVTALDNWMTEESVVFNSTLEYEVDEETEALLIFESANPSGLDENQMTYTVPVTLSASN